MIVDEPAYLRDIHGLVNHKQGLVVTDFQWDYSQATLFYYPTILLAQLLRTTPDLFILRLTSVLFSLGGLVTFYLILTQRINKYLAFCVTLLFAFSYYYLQFSRVGWGVIYTTVLGLYYFYFLDLAFRKKQLFWFTLSGFVGGIIFYGYRAAEVYLIAGFAFLLIKTVCADYSSKKKVTVLLIFLGTFFITAFPWINKISQNWELYNMRQRVVSVFNTKPYHGMTDTTKIIKYQISTTIKSWVLLEPVDGGGIENSRYLPLKDSPVNLIIRILFILGLFISLRRFKTTYVWWIVYLLGLIFGQILTVDPPNGARALIILPMIYFFAALALEKIYRLYPKRLWLLTIIIVVLLTAYHDFAYYQHWVG